MIWKPYSLDRGEVLFAIISLSIAFKFCSSESTTTFLCPNIQLNRNRGATRALGRQHFSIHPMAQFSRRREVTMDVRDELRRLDAVPGMPETIGVTPNPNTSLVNIYNDNSSWLDSALRNGVNVFLSTRGEFNLSTPKLPGYSIKRTKPNTSTDQVFPPQNRSTNVAREVARVTSQGNTVGKVQETNELLNERRPRAGAIADDPVFRAATVKDGTRYLERKERKRDNAARTEAAPARIDSTRVPNLWIAVAHSSSLRAGKTLKVEVDGVPIALWRSTTGEINAFSDVCIHRGASLSRGWVSAGNLVCPYHGFEYATDGRLVHIPGAAPQASAPAAAGKVRAWTDPPCLGAVSGRSGGGKKGGRRAPTYLVKEAGGWIYLFPDSKQLGTIEQYQEPTTIPEACSREFRAVQGSVDIRGGVEACVENMLDILHISYVHMFGNMQEPTPYEITYAEGFDDPGSEALATSQVTFRYQSGGRSFSKVVGQSPEVVVKNEFHLPYRAVIRVFFGKKSLKTIEATAVPTSEGTTMLHWKIYRNFALTHPLDEGPINRTWDFVFRRMMEITLQEDKDIIESVYPKYQRGFMNGHFDRQMLRFRSALKKFKEVAEERAQEQMESSLQMELLKRIASSRRGLQTTSNDRAVILDLIKRLEGIQQESTIGGGDGEEARNNKVVRKDPSKGGKHAESTSNARAAASLSTEGPCKADGVPSVLHNDNEIEGQWHLGYVFNGDQDGWDFEGSSDLEKEKRVAALREAGGEARLIDWNAEGRPLWADASESIQIIDGKTKTLTNRAVYKGWSGLTTVVQLDAAFESDETKKRLIVDFHKAIVDVGGIRVTFPHLQRFSPTGWLETTYMNRGIWISRGNKGSIFVLTRQPMATMTARAVE